ncbi:Acyl-CoA N-acyltransferase [Penicillium malachiteum]|uniref:Acyl-CoA N-acyltransferase n=1 Tax=Penicillium malachiteum TaxID=1324776 RepID=UPI0025467432|nr:Acyl-CoA N-acyltransferase [Penicillium malachiteum]KAJ5735278.1 Acyl-CoA N-acyltransferase [Penicillium malachiteum]
MAFTQPASWITPRTWSRDNKEFFVSNDPALLSVEAVKEAFASDFIYWANASIPDDALRQMLYGSMSFGVYKRTQSQGNTAPSSTKNTEQIGLARMMTDGVSFAYLSDVYVLPQYQGKGLGTWLIDCVAEIFSKENMPYLRRIMLFTGDPRTEEMYTNVFDMRVLGHEERPDFPHGLNFLCARPNAKVD